MDLRTFLKPSRSSTVEPLPSVGKPAPCLPGEGATGRAHVVAFLRHIGCPFAEATMRTLCALSRRNPDVQFVAVSHGTPAATDRWCLTLGAPGAVRVIHDPAGALYAAWGLGLTSLGHFLGIQSLRAVAHLAMRGIRNRHPSGTRWQSAGTFAVDASAIVRWRHLPAHAGDLPDVNAALDALRRTDEGHVQPDVADGPSRGPR